MRRRGVFTAQSTACCFDSTFLMRWPSSNTIKSGPGDCGRQSEPEIIRAAPASTHMGESTRAAAAFGSSCDGDFGGACLQVRRRGGGTARDQREEGFEADDAHAALLLPLGEQRQAPLERLVRAHLVSSRETVTVSE